MTKQKWREGALEEYEKHSEGDTRTTMTGGTREETMVGGALVERPGGTRETIE